MLQAPPWGPPGVRAFCLCTGWPRRGVLGIPGFPASHSHSLWLTDTPPCAPLPKSRGWGRPDLAGTGHPGAIRLIAASRKVGGLWEAVAGQTGQEAPSACLP